MTPKPQANTLDEILETLLYGHGAVETHEPTYFKAKQQLLAEVLDIIGENELNEHPEVVGSPTAAKLWTRDVFREELRKTAKKRFK